MSLIKKEEQKNKQKDVSVTVKSNTVSLLTTSLPISVLAGKSTWSNRVSERWMQLIALAMTSSTSHSSEPLQMPPRSTTIVATTPCVSCLLFSTILTLLICY